MSYFPPCLFAEDVFIAKLFGGKKKDIEIHPAFEPGSSDTLYCFSTEGEMFPVNPWRGSDGTCKSGYTQLAGVAAESTSVLITVSCFGTHHAG